MGIMFRRIPSGHGGKREEEAGLEIMIGVWRERLMENLSEVEVFVRFIEWRCS